MLSNMEILQVCAACMIFFVTGVYFGFSVLKSEYDDNLIRNLHRTNFELTMQNFNLQRALNKKNDDGD